MFTNKIPPNASNSATEMASKSKSNDWFSNFSHLFAMLEIIDACNQIIINQVYNWERCSKLGKLELNWKIKKIKKVYYVSNKN